MAKNKGIESGKPLIEVRVYRDQLAAEGKRVVMTNGCFDLLHVGHIHLLKTARSFGDFLVVAINGDASVRALKGSERPVHSAEDRVEILEALECVDAVVVFENPRATAAIEAIAPDVYVKGGDYDLGSLDSEEKAALERMGAEIRFVEIIQGRSTTASLATLNLEMPLRLGFLGSGRGGTLLSLLKAIADGRLKEEISLVVSDVADSGVLSIARERGLPCYWIDSGASRSRFPEDRQRALADLLKEASIDLVILGGFMRRLNAFFIEQFPKRILNLHPSLLPRFPGREAWKQALEAGERQTGSTVHIVDEGIDTGRILGQVPVSVLPDDTPSKLLARIQEAESEIYPRVIDEYGAQLRFRGEL